MDFKRGYCGNGWAALTMLTFAIHSCIAGNLFLLNKWKIKKNKIFCVEILNFHVVDFFG